MIASAGLVQANGVGCFFQARMYALRWSRSAVFEGKSVMLRAHPTSRHTMMTAANWTKAR
jgi:hypothetical protein